MKTTDLPGLGDDGLWHWPTTTAQVWPRWLRTDRGGLMAAFDENTDQPPQAGVMLAVGDDGTVLGGVMKETFRRRAKRSFEGRWTLAPVMPPRAVQSLYKRCDRDGCDGHAPFQTNMQFLCQEHWAELCDAPWEH